MPLKKRGIASTAKKRQSVGGYLAKRISMKTIVTHIGPDLDAITSVWLVKTFLPNWEEAQIAFVPAGTTLNNIQADSNPDILHVDTGFGKFDHHQTNENICAATLVYDEIKTIHGENPALERLVMVVNDVDHFAEVFYPNPTAHYWHFQLAAVIDGWRLMYAEDPQRIISLGMEALDAVYKTIQNRIWAEKEIQEKGKEFQTKWGKSLAIETTNDDVMHLAQKSGYQVVIRKDPKKGYARIKSVPLGTIDLRPFYEALKEQDKDATWFLHASNHMILNGSTKNPNMKPTRLTLDQIMEISKTL
jgi:hypothetical protein